MSEALNVNVLVSAKEEYTEQLCFILSPLILQGIFTIFEDSKRLPKEIRGVSYRNFQIGLVNIQNWSSFVMEKESKRIKESCKYLNDLVTAIFVSHVKILACVRLKGDNKNIKIKIPSMDIFIHKIYLLVGNKFYNNVYLINEPEEKLINIVSDIINECIRKQLPIEHILQEYLYDVFNDSDDDENSKDNETLEDRTLSGTDIIEDTPEKDSDEESEFEEEQKSIPIIPINGSPNRAGSPEPQFEEETTQINVPQSIENTPQQQGNNSDNNIPDISLNDELQGPLSPNPSHELNSRPESPITLFNDADNYSP